MILVIDNYDSFTYNLVHYIGECNFEVLVKRNDELTINEIHSLNPEKIVISPGPCTPKEAGISIEIVQESQVPLLGVCLGHQSIGVAFGANVVRAKSIMHGKVSAVIHGKKGLFSGLPSPYNVTRYHSLALEKKNLPPCFDITAWTDDQEIMAINHKTLPFFGVQYHPEAILTEYGFDLLKNFLDYK